MDARLQLAIEITRYQIIRMANVKSLFLSTWSLFSVNLVPFWSFFCEKSGPFLVPIRDFFLQGPDLSSLHHPPLTGKIPLIGNPTLLNQFLTNPSLHSI